MNVYLLVNLHADGSLGDVPDSSGTSMVELVRHSLVNSTVDLNVDIVADLVDLQVSGESDVTLLPERPREEVPSPRAETMSGRHFLVVIGLGFPENRAIKVVLNIYGVLAFRYDNAFSGLV